jgi:hypothetical protein
MTSLRSIIIIAVCALASATPSVTEAASGFMPPNRSYIAATTAAHLSRPAPEFEWQLALGCGAVAMLILARLHEPRFPQFYYLSAISACICCWYGFASGAWPLGIAVGAYTIRLLMTRPRKYIRRVYDIPEAPVRARLHWHEPTRLARLFGN